MTSPQPSGVDDYQGAQGPAASTGTDFGALYGVDAATAALQVQTGLRGEPTGNVNARAAERGDTDPRAHTPLTQSIAAILQSLNAMNSKSRKSLQDMLVKGGYLNENYVASGSVDKDFVRGFVDMLSEYSRSNVIPETSDGPGGINQSVSWAYYLNQQVQAHEAGKKEKEKEANPPKVRLLSMTEAAPAYKEAFRQAVGREPTASEIRSFVDSYNAKAKENPLTTSVEMVDGVEVTSTSGGVAEDFMGDQIEENPDYANYQAVATYFPRMESLLSAPNDINTVGF